MTVGIFEMIFWFANVCVICLTLVACVAIIENGNDEDS